MRSLLMVLAALSLAGEAVYAEVYELPPPGHDDGDGVQPPKCGSRSIAVSAIRSPLVYGRLGEPQPLSNVWNSPR